MDLQKAGIFKRVAAALFDLILLATLATGFLWLLNAVVGFDGYHSQLAPIQEKYAAEYGIDMQMTQETYDAMSEEEKADYMARVEAADAAINADEEAVYLFNLVCNLILINASLSILLAMVILEFVVPLLFGNGQTLGKKIFAICLMRTDGVKLNNLQLFARTILGKYAVGIMIPVYALIMLFMNILGMPLLLLVTGLMMAQGICLVVTRNNSLLHDLLAGTVVVDYNSQQIFRSTEELVEFQKKVAAERAARQTY